MTISAQVNDKYTVVVSFSLQELEQEVNVLLCQGYKPQGGILVEPSPRIDHLRPWAAQRDFYQAMLKE